MTKNDVLNQMYTIKETLMQKYGVIKIGLFGSYARDEQNENSDIDIAVELEKDKKTIHTFLALKRELEILFGKHVDLGIESTLKPIAKQYILKEIIYV
jgi:predicted nucleotidyltransferase